MNKEAVISDTVHTHSHAPQTNKYKRVFLFQGIPKLGGSEEQQPKKCNVLTRARFKFLYCTTEVNYKYSEPKFFSKESLSMGEMTASHFPQTLLCEFMLTPHCQLEPILGDPPPPTSKSLFCSTLPSLVHSFSAKSQIGGWGVFCGLYKRTKVVRTLLYESVGRGAVTQTASLSSLSLHGPTGLCCSLATVTHGEGESQT